MKRKMTEATLIKKLNNLFPELKAKPLSEFYDDKSAEGIWCAGNYDAIDGEPAYDDYEEWGYRFNPKLVAVLDAAGWYCEPYDCETLTLYKNY
jgi:hypothetical protein